MKRLNIYEFAEQHKDCPTVTKEYVIGGKKYIVHSHFVGDKDAHEVVFKSALNHAIDDTFGVGSYDPEAFDNNDNDGIKEIKNIA